MFLFLPLFFFNDSATTEIYTLSLHDALPICRSGRQSHRHPLCRRSTGRGRVSRSEEHTSELQSRRDLVCRLLLEKKKQEITSHNRRLPDFKCVGVLVILKNYILQMALMKINL